MTGSDDPILTGLPVTPIWNTTDNKVLCGIDLTASQTNSLIKGQQRYRIYAILDNDHATEFIYKALCQVL